MLMLGLRRLFHGGCSADDPSGATDREAGRGPSDLLRAIYILGMAPTRLQTPEILAARRQAYELDLFWPLPRDHADIAARVLAQNWETANWAAGSQGVRCAVEGEGTYPVVREFARAPPEWQRLIDPTWRPAAIVKL